MDGRAGAVAKALTLPYALTVALLLCKQKMSSDG